MGPRLSKSQTMRIVRRRLTWAGVVVLLAAPGAASADISVDVPARFLGGPIASPLPVAAPPGAVGGGAGLPSAPPEPGPAATGDLRSELPELGPPPPEGSDAPLPAPVAEDPATGDPEPAVDLTPVTVVPLDEDPAAAVPAAPPTDLATAFGDLLSPAAASWLPWQTPMLRWGAAPGASHYNVQVFRGARRVLNAWPSATRLRVPEGVLRQGRTYVWAVWPGIGRRADRRFGPALGRSTFQLTLRPRIVLRTPGGRRGGVVAEVRPHIPFGTLRLAAPRRLAGRVPDRITIDRRGRFALPVSRRAAERLRARLVHRGPSPPIGLRG